MGLAVIILIVIIAMIGGFISGRNYEKGKKEEIEDDDYLTRYDQLIRDPHTFWSVLQYFRMSASQFERDVIDYRSALLEEEFEDDGRECDKGISDQLDH